MIRCDWMSAVATNASNKSECHMTRRPSPTIGIITVCLNDYGGLLRTRNSLLEQTRFVEEWIVIDGGSIDDTVRILESEQLPFLRWRSERDFGIYDAMNKGLALAQSEYVLFLNSGDTLASRDVLQELEAACACADHEVVLLFGDAYEVNPSGRRFLKRARSAAWIRIGMPTPHQAMVFRKSAIASGYDLTYLLAGDYDLVCRLVALHGTRCMARIDFAVCNFFLGGVSTRRVVEMAREAARIRLQVLGMSALSVGLLELLHRLHAWIKQWMPWLHVIYRYKTEKGRGG